MKYQMQTHLQCIPEHNNCLTYTVQHTQLRLERVAFVSRLPLANSCLHIRFSSRPRTRYQGIATGMRSQSLVWDFEGAIALWWDWIFTDSSNNKMSLLSPSTKYNHEVIIYTCTEIFVKSIIVNKCLNDSYQKMLCINNDFIVN